MILAHAPPLGEETVDLAAALGRTLRQSIAADRDQPPFHRSAMDGFAVRSADALAHDWPIAGSIAAGQPGGSLPAHAVTRIATGAPLPDHADAVIQIEKAQVTGDRVRFTLDKIAPWQNVHRRASDAKAGDALLAAGTRLGPQHIGIAAAVGAHRLRVAAVPRITILTSGDEVMPPQTPGSSLLSHQIRNSNGPMLSAFCAALGAPPIEHRHIPDEPQHTLAAAREALSRSHLVITVGGVSVGQRDYLPMAWSELGLHTVLHGVSIQPGKPVFVARDECKLVVGLPGNPVSVWTTAHLFVWPLLLKMLQSTTGLPWRDVPLAQPAKANPSRQLFRAASLDNTGRASLVNWHGSGDLMHTAAGAGFIRLPVADATLSAGTIVPYLSWV